MQKARRLAKVTHSNQPGKGAGYNRNPGDSSSPPELSLAVLECDEDAAEAHLAALTTLVHGAAGTIHVTEITSTWGPARGCPKTYAKPCGMNVAVRSTTIRPLSKRWLLPR